MLSSDSSTATSLDDILGDPRIENEAKRSKSAGEQADSDASGLACAKISIFDSSLESLEWHKENTEEDKALKSAGEDGLRRQDSDGDEYQDEDEEDEEKEDDGTGAVARSAATSAATAAPSRKVIRLFGLHLLSERRAGYMSAS